MQQQSNAHIALCGETNRHHNCPAMHHKITRVCISKQTCTKLLKTFLITMHALLSLKLLMTMLRNITISWTVSCCLSTK
uniref:Uncharacterized protein n=1 Tax=Setaria italica TaxID=4555 RepID=K3ZYN5_SETIT